MKTHLVVSAFAGLVAVSAHALVCDHTFYFQSAQQMILTGPTANGLTAQAPTNLDKSMNGVEVIYPEARYEVMTRFDGAGACSEFKKTSVDYATREKGQVNFRNVTSNNVLIKLNATPYVYQPSLQLDYWFAFASGMKGDTALVFEAVTKPKNASRMHQWYGNALVTKKVFVANVGTPKYTSTEAWPELHFNADSAKLVEDLLHLWKDIKSNDTQNVTFRVQLIKVVYDSTEPKTALRPSARGKAGGFQASQTGSMVLIQPGEKVGPSAEALGVYDMLGHRVATLHPTGYLYQWNGRTSAGAEAPTGVYFVQAGGRILGKFFFTR